jgi:PiT family inorganic phosphate transporter
MAAAITVIIASQLGLPVSSTHIAVGGIFGVGFLREYLGARRKRRLEMIREQHENQPPEVLENVLAAYEAADFKGKGQLIARLKAEQDPGMIKADRKGLKKAYREELVQRSMLLKIAAAWVTTVPLAGVLAALLYFTIRGMMMPY